MYDNDYNVASQSLFFVF